MAGRWRVSQVFVVQAAAALGLFALVGLLLASGRMGKVELGVLPWAFHLLHLVLRRSANPFRALFWYGWLLGALYQGVAVAVIGVVTGAMTGGIGSAVAHGLLGLVGSVVGLVFIGGPLGLFGAVLMVPLVNPAVAENVRPTARGFTLVVRHAGVWLCSVASASVPFILASRATFGAPGWEPAVVAWLIGSAAALVSVAADARYDRRLAALVARGGLEVVTTAELPGASEAVPLDQTASEAWVVGVPSAVGMYRTSAERAALLRVPRDLGLHLRTRSRWRLGVVAWVVACSAFNVWIMRA